jgi:hypothetical protein
MPSHGSRHKLRDGKRTSALTVFRIFVEAREPVFPIKSAFFPLLSHPHGKPYYSTRVPRRCGRKGGYVPGALISAVRFGERMARNCGTLAALWDAIKPNVTRLTDAPDLARLATGPVRPVIEDAALAAAAGAVLPPIAAASTPKL